MAEYRFKTPLSESRIRQLRVGDSVILDGIIFGIRDANMIRVFDQKAAPPVDWRGAALLHTAPNVRKVGPGKYEPISVGTTTSMRMDRFTEGLLRLSIDGNRHGSVLQKAAAQPALCAT